ncbi:MAG: hypothetical protein Q9174_003046 [Haloplaca sp. 1 TL-2023]
MKSAQPSEQSGFESRVGYFGICVGTASELACVASVGSSAEDVVKRISRNVNEARSSILSSPRAQAVLKIALDTQSKLMPFVILAAGFMFIFGLICVLLLQLETKKAQRKVNSARKITVLKRLMLCFVWTSTALAISAAFSMTQLAKMVHRNNASSVSVVSSSLVVEAGAGVQVLQWLAASFSFLFSIGMASMFMVTGDHHVNGRSGSGSGDDY